MEKIINGYSVDENLCTGTEFHGNLGILMGVVELGDHNIAVIKNQQGQYTYRDTVIDTSVSMTKGGPNVSEQILVSSTEKQFDDRMIDFINENLPITGNLDFLGNGEINVDLGLQQHDNSVFVADDDFLNHLRTCKLRYPELPLNFALKMIPYEKESSKAI